MSKSQLDYLDRIAAALQCGGDEGWRVLSTGERLYAAMAANRHDLLQADGYTMAQAIARLGSEWTAELVERWQYGTPDGLASEAAAG